MLRCCPKSSSEYKTPMTGHPWLTMKDTVASEYSKFVGTVLKK